MCTEACKHTAWWGRDVMGAVATIMGLLISIQYKPHPFQAPLSLPPSCPPWR